MVPVESKYNFARKPPKGTLGRPIPLWTNHFKVVLKKPILVYQYDVELIDRSGKSDDKVVKIKSAMKYIIFFLNLIYKKYKFSIIKKLFQRDMLEELIKNHLPQYRNKIVYNFSKNLYSVSLV